jgi:hypothetical protein
VAAAIITVIGTLGAAAIANWGNIFPHNPRPPHYAPGGPVGPPVGTPPNSGSSDGGNTPPTPVPFASTTPHLLSPDANAVLNDYPRLTNFSWASVPGAASYRFELEFGDPSGQTWTPYSPVIVTSPSSTVDFIGAQPGRWRVTALDANQQPDQTTDWRIFTYTR